MHTRQVRSGLKSDKWIRRSSSQYIVHEKMNRQACVFMVALSAYATLIAWARSAHLGPARYCNTSTLAASEPPIY